MQITYDTEVDAMYIKFKDGKFIRNKEIEDGKKKFMLRGGLCILKSCHQEVK